MLWLASWQRTGEGHHHQLITMSPPFDSPALFVDNYYIYGIWYTVAFKAGYVPGLRYNYQYSKDLIHSCGIFSMLYLYTYQVVKAVCRWLVPRKPGWCEGCTGKRTTPPPPFPEGIGSHDYGYA